MSQTNYLQRIAQAMRAEVEETGQLSSRDLSHGLALTLAHVGDAWLLVLQRDDVAPSTTEIATVRRDFAVPADAQQLSLCRVTSLCWTERPEPAAVSAPQQLELV